MTRAILVLSDHRPETVSPAARLMARYDTVVLEEPPDPGFEPMLDGRLGIADYRADQDIEYPEFSLRMARALRKLHRAGRRILQLEPFLEHLLAIHAHFAAGGRPTDLDPETHRGRVYRVEREATAALIAFYRAAASGAFEETVAAVKAFARADARRLALRDRMRAEALSGLLAAPGSWYIEAGSIHYPLGRELGRRLPEGTALRVHFLMGGAARALGSRRHLYGPGDWLTLHYRLHPGLPCPREDLLAARALVHNKLLAKDELAPRRAAGPAVAGSAAVFPHTADQLTAGATVARLSLADCRRLFPLVQRGSSAAVREALRRLGDGGHHDG